MSTMSLEDLPSSLEGTSSQEETNSTSTNVGEEQNAKTKKKINLESNPLSNYSSDLKNWEIFGLLQPEFVPRVHMIMAFDDRSALIVTKDKMVYGIGGNENNQLGIGDTDKTLEPKKVEALCGKNIKIFYCNNLFGYLVFALTEEGEVYSWGYNKDDIMLALGFNIEEIDTPTKVIIDECIIDIAYSSDHIVILASDGKVYTSGNSEYVKLLGKEYSLGQVKDNLEGKKIISIACGKFFSMVLSNNGNIYSWGINTYGQLGIGNCKNQMQPCLITSLVDVEIVKIACGNSHALALTANGTIYSWGRNDVGQLGHGKKIEYKMKPSMVTLFLRLVSPNLSHCENKCYNIREVTIIEFILPMREIGRRRTQAVFLNLPEMEKVSDITTSKDYDRSIAVGENRLVYVWGECFGQEIAMPTVTNFSNLCSMFNFKYELSYIIHNSLIDHSEEESNILECLGAAFDDASTSDFAIQVEEQTIHVHKAILKIRSQHFRNLFQHDWLENDQNVIVHKQFSYIVYKAFLKYIYTGMVDVPSEKALELMKLADAYDETNLKENCIQVIKGIVTISNVALVYEKAIKYNSKELEKFCFQFALDHLTNVVQTENFANLKDITRLDFTIKAARAGAFKN